MAEPTSLFLAAALTAGFVEGASVLGYHRHRHALALLSSTIDSSSSGKNILSTPIESDNATVPSVSILAAHTILYGLVAAPLGLVGASPGLAFLPSNIITVRSTLMNDKKETPVEPNDACESRPRVVEETHIIPSPIVTTTDSHGNRNLGWVLRQENSKKIATHNKLLTRPAFSDLESSSMHKIKPDDLFPSASAATSFTTRNGTSMMQPSSSRYIATLDGKPLPTALAESMRRARCLFIGAGLISYVMAQYYSDSRRHQYLWENAEPYNLVSNVRNGKYAVEFGYDQWINTKSVNLWNERIQKGKSVDDYGALFHKLHSDETSHQRGHIHSHFLPNNTITDVLEILVDGINRAMQLAKFQLVKESDIMVSDAKNTIVKECTTATSGAKGNIQPATTPPVELDSTDPAMSESQPSQQGIVMPSASWSVVVTTVDVLGTSIRHLFESTYQLASSAASLGRRSASREPTTDDKSQSPG